MSKKNKNKKNTELPLTPPPHPAVIRARELAAAEAKIRDENLRIAEERRNIKQCPDCGAPYPLVSNICPHCGHVLHEQQGAEYNIRTLIDNINTSIDTLKNAPKPTFLQVLWYRLDLVILYFAVTMVIVIVYYYNVYSLFQTVASKDLENQFIGWLMFAMVVYVGYLVHSVNKTSQKKVAETVSPLQRADNEFYAALHANEKYLRQTETIYGDNPEAKTLLKNLAAEIDAVQKARNSNRLKLTLLIVGFTLIPVLLYIIGPTYKAQYIQYRAEHDDAYQMSAYQKTLKTLPGHAVADTLGQYLIIDGNATLMFDIEKIGDDQPDKFRIRIDRVNIASTGKKIENLDTCTINATLYDKNMKPLADSLVALTAEGYDLFVDAPIYNLLTRGRTHYHESFATKDTYTSVDSLRRIADSAYYFSIY